MGSRCNQSVTLPQNRNTNKQRYTWRGLSNKRCVTCRLRNGLYFCNHISGSMSGRRLFHQFLRWAVMYTFFTDFTDAKVTSQEFPVYWRQKVQDAIKETVLFKLECILGNAQGIVSWHFQIHRHISLLRPISVCRKTYLHIVLLKCMTCN